jgi:hypothetical protein
MAARETHTTARPVRIPEEDWAEFGQLVGDRERSRILREFIAWYLHRPKATLPRRPDAQAVRDAQVARSIAES